MQATMTEQATESGQQVRPVYTLRGALPQKLLRPTLMSQLLFPPSADIPPQPYAECPTECWRDLLSSPPQAALLRGAGKDAAGAAGRQPGDGGAPGAGRRGGEVRVHRPPR